MSFREIAGLNDKEKIIFAINQLICSILQYYPYDLDITIANNNGESPFLEPHKVVCAIENLLKHLKLDQEFVVVNSNFPLIISNHMLKTLNDVELKKLSEKIKDYAFYSDESYSDEFIFNHKKLQCFYDPQAVRRIIDKYNKTNTLSW